MKKIILVTGCVALLAAGCALGKDAKKVSPQELNVATQTSQPTPTTTPTNTPTFNAVSLPALMQKQFDGRDLSLGKILANEPTYTRYYITYKSGELTISGIMNVPKGNGPFPVLILNHGYIDPAVYTNGRGLKREQDYLARQGFVVLHPDYRNHAQSTKDETVEEKIRLGYVEDVINAVVAIKNSGLDFIDTGKIGMLGHSMGGGITQAVLVTRPDLVDAAILYAPVSMDAAKSYERWTTTRPEVVEKIKKLYGAPEDNAKFWADVSPKNFVDRIAVPVQIHHGTKDADVPYEWSQETEKLLQQAGKSVSLVTYEGEGHEFGSQWTAFMQRTAEFFKQNL